MSTIAEAKKLIEKEMFSEAKVLLEKNLTATDLQDEKSKSHFLLGEIFSSTKNSQKNINLAKEHYLNSIKIHGCIPEAYVKYSRLEKDHNVALNYLRLGYERFPIDSGIFQNLFCKEYPEEREKLISYCLKTTSISSNVYLENIITHLWDQKRWKDLEKLFKRILKSKPEGKVYFYTETLLGYILLFLRGNYCNIIRLFSNAIKTDIDNVLCYCHYVGIVCAYIRNENITEAEKIFDKIPECNALSDQCLLHGDPYVVPVLSMYGPAFNLIFDTFKNDNYRLVKAKCLFSCFKISTYCPWNEDDINEDDIKTLKKFLSLYHNTEIYNTLLLAYFILKNPSEAWHVLLLQTKHNKNDANHYSANRILNDLSESEFELAISDAKSNPQSTEIFLHNIIDPIIANLYKKKRYPDIRDIVNKVARGVLYKSENLFEIAYSLGKCSDCSNKRIYLKILQDDPGNSSALNNLGVIFTAEGDYENAYEHYKQAYQISAEDALIHRNFLSSSKKHKESIKICDAFENRTPDFKRKVLEFCEYADAERCIELTIDELVENIGLSQAEVSAIWQEMLENNYIEKIKKDDKYAYRVNILIWKFLQKNKDFLRANVDYEILSEELNVDSLKKIGYDKEIEKRLAGISTKTVKEMLLRDLRECAISIVIGSYKSAIIISGGAIEHILMQALDKAGVSSYDVGTLLNGKAKTKKTDEMNLGELLEVANVKNIIKKDNYHLSQFARKYRNAIHPTVELKMASEINKENALMLWKILLNVIYDCF